MKTFKIIGLIALLIVLFEFIGDFNDGWNDVDKLASISIESADPAFDKVTATTFDVLPDSAIQATNSQTGTNVPTGFMQCHSYIVPSGLTNFTYILLGITGLVSFYGLYNPHPSVYLYHPQRGIYIHQYPTDTVGSLSSYCLSPG